MAREGPAKFKIRDEELPLDNTVPFCRGRDKPQRTSLTRSGERSRRSGGSPSRRPRRGRPRRSGHPDPGLLVALYSQGGGLDD